ncbi:MAG: HEAT repeat domain-containing protein, partial [Myxococcota bacterium]
MTDAAFEAQLDKGVSSFYETFFVRGAENRFEELMDDGQGSFPELISVLCDTDRGERVDALVALGRLFSSHGPTDDSLRAVVNHAKTIHEDGMGPERHAALFAIGRSGDTSLIEGFMPLLAAPDADAVTVACYVFGYARWKPALPFLKYLVDQNERQVVQAAIWALGQIGDADALDLLLPMLRRAENVEWLVGALGDIGDVSALDALLPLLSSEVTDIRVLTIMSIYAIVEQNKDRKVRRDLTWMESALRTAAKD